MMPLTLSFTIIYSLVVVHIGWTWWCAVQNGRIAHLRPQQETAVPTTWPLVSIIIPAWREKGTVEQCIASLRQVLVPEWEAIVVAGGDDGTYEAALTACDRDPRLRVLRQRPLGKNGALNAGLSMTQGEIIVLLDADSQIQANWLEELVKPIARGKTAVTTGRYIPNRQTPIARYAIMTRIAAYEVAQSATLQGSGSIAMSRQIVNQLGGFDERVPVGVDWDLHVRVQQFGVRPIYCHDAVVTTSRPATVGEFWQNERRWRKAHLAAVWRHRHFLLNSIPKAIMQLFFYGLSLGMAVLATLLLGTLLRGATTLAAVLGLIGLGLAVWMLGRRAAIAGLVAAYENDRRWLHDFWVPPFLLVLSMAASVAALVTFNRLSPHFKGPRAEVVS